MVHTLDMLQTSMCRVKYLQTKHTESFFRITLCKNVKHGEEDQETYSGHVTKKDQWVYIKIECLKSNTVPIITSDAWLIFL